MAPPITPFVNDPDWINSLPAAASAPSVFANAPQDPGTPPPMAKVAMTSAPPVFDTPAPPVTRQATPIETQIGETDQRLRKLQSMDANPFGSANNHPGVGGKILHALSVAGNLAGNIFAPATMELLPGTQANRGLQENSLSNRLQSLTQQEGEDEARGATTAKTQEETAEMPGKDEREGKLTDAQVRNLDSEATDRDAALVNPPLATAYSHAVNQAIKEGRDPQQDPIVQHLADAITSLQKQGPPGTKTVQLEVNGKPHQVLVDERSGATVRDLGESGEKPAQVNVNAGEAALDREAKQFGNSHQKSLDASNAQLEKIADGRAMINGNAESQGLGIPKVLTALVGGQGTGVRITQAELTSIAHARGLSGDVEGTLNKWAGKGALSRQQQQQLTQILDDVKARILQKQAIASAALDTINSAGSREQIIQADKDARKKLSDLENGNGGSDLITVQIPGQPPGQIHASQKAAFLAKYPNAKVQ